MAFSTKSTKLINISNACKDGCRLEATEAALSEEMAVRIAQHKALTKVVKLAQALGREPVQSRSVERRFALLIEAAAAEGLES